MSCLNIVWKNKILISYKYLSIPYADNITYLCCMCELDSFLRHLSFILRVVSTLDLIRIENFLTEERPNWTITYLEMKLLYCGLEALHPLEILTTALQRCTQKPTINAVVHPTIRDATFVLRNV